MQRADTWVRPYNGVMGWLIGVVSLWRNWSVFRVGNRSLAPIPSDRWFGRDTWHVGIPVLGTQRVV
ncbi:MAG: hypothetical protein WCD37_18255 [Chloroflexia bacterium]